MELELHIEDAVCIKCLRCVRVCPSRIFYPEEGAEGKIGLQNVSGCIACGHCVAACPAGAVVHSEFPPKKVYKIDRRLLPTPEQVMLLCKSRRSNRAFLPDPVPGSMLDQILEAAHRAPTASNLQQVEFTLVTDPGKLKEIGRYTIDVFASVARKLENPLWKPLLKRILPGAYGYLPAFHRLDEEWRKGNDLVLRGATAAIFIHTPEKNRFGMQDANLAYENGSLMAESLGISQFYTGFVCSAGQQDKGGLEKLLGVSGKVQAGMALGMPMFKFPNYIDKKKIKVTRI